MERLGSIVVIDDEVDIVESLTALLGDAGFDVRGFTEPTLAMQYLIGAAVDVVVTDFRMPGLTGGEVLRLVKNLDQNIPVIFVTGQCTRENLLEAVNDGVHFVIEKPWQPELVVETCRNASRTRRLATLLDSALGYLTTSYRDLGEPRTAGDDADQRRRLQTQIRALMNEKKLARRRAA